MTDRVVTDQVVEATCIVMATIIIGEIYDKGF